jgi:hypothetical protein
MVSFSASFSTESSVSRCSFSQERVNFMAASSPQALSVPPPLAGEGQGGGSLRNGGGNCFDDAAAVYHHVVIAEAKHLEAFCFNRGRALRIGPFAFIGKMLAAVEFNDELRGVTNEIGNISLDRDLPAEACTVQPIAS